MSNNKAIFLTILSIVLLKTYFTFPERAIYRVSSLSISSDGRYVLSAHRNNFLVLWDLKKRTSKLLSNQASRFSTYFIKNSHHYLWQNIKNNQVYLSDINQKVLDTIPLDFRAYGHVMTSNEKTYIASDYYFNVYKIKKNKKELIKPQDDFHKFEPEALTMNFQLSNDDKKMLTGFMGNSSNDNELAQNLAYEYLNKDVGYVKSSPFLGLVLWDLKTGRPEHHYGGNIYKTSAALSPDGHYVVSGDENSQSFIWHADTAKEFIKLWGLRFGEYVPGKKGESGYFKHNKVIPEPDDFCYRTSSYSYNCTYSSTIFAIRFINNDQYLRFTTYVPYAILYNVTEPEHKQYLKLEGHPDVYGYQEVISVATAPSVERLVMATSISSGIRVYQYRRSQQSLRMIWAPDSFTTTRWQQFSWFWWPRFKKALLG